MTSLSVLMPGFVGTELPSWLDEMLRRGLGGVCLFGENVVSRQQVRELTDAIRAANPDAVIAIDEEGGDVTRLYYEEGSPFPGNAVLGRIDDPLLTEAVGASVGSALAGVGVNLDFAPDADVNSNPHNPVIGVRSFGADAAQVSRHTSAWVRGLQSAGVAACAKHFPGHGDTAQDSHLSLPTVDVPVATLRGRELAPFRAAVEAGSLAIMTSHIVLPRVDSEPATFSAPVLGGLLRDELGFDGVIVSDALDMVGASGVIGIPAAAVRALAAGCDLLCIGTRNTAEQLESIASAIDRAVESGELPHARLGEAGDRVAALARELPTLPFAAPEPSFDTRSTRGAFDVRPDVLVRSERTLVALETEANIAVGTVPWGPRVDIRIGQGEALPVVHGQLVLVGRDNHRHEWVRELVTAARSSHASVLVVDMGWPGDDRAFADVATFGASRHVGLALEQWLDGVAR
jgi:beta-N-acetylhexosaminidase